MTKASLIKKEAKTRMARRGTDRIRWSSPGGAIEWRYMTEGEALREKYSHQVCDLTSNKKVLRQEIVEDGVKRSNIFWNC